MRQSPRTLARARSVWRASTRVVAMPLLLCLVLLVSGSGIPIADSSGPPAADAARLDPAPDTDEIVGDRSIATTGCRQPAPFKPGTSEEWIIPSDPALANGATTRSFRVHLPTGYRPGQARALVLVFHGSNGTSASIEETTDFSALADHKGFIAVYPQGVLGSKSAESFWASAGTIDDGVDDVRFVDEMLSQLQRTLCVDPRRIAATGFSNGGAMSALLACRLASRIAAFASVSGNYVASPDGCKPSRPAPMLEIHGTDDGVVPYDGAVPDTDSEAALPPVPLWLEQWATRDGCAPVPTIFLQNPIATAERWNGCRAGSAVVHYRIEGGEHAWPPVIDSRSGSGVIWDFLNAHPLPVARV